MNIDISTRMKTGFILIVDDSPVQRDVLKYFLELNNYKVLQAEDAEEALSILEEITPALIITDIVMPKMDGYELCKKLRLNKNTMKVPVILLTVLSSSEDMLKGLECGADGFISKPYSEDYLVTLVEKTMDKKGLIQNQTVTIPFPVYLRGIETSLTIDPSRIITLMISAYESALSKNKELSNAQTELKTLNDHLEDLVAVRTEELSKLNAEKDKFFSIIAHDLKSPFSGFIGLTELMATNSEDCTKEEMRDFSIEMNKNALNLFKLLQNLLEWAKMQNGTVDFLPQNISLAEIISENVDLINKRGEQKGIEIINKIPENFFVLADQAMLNSIIRNLLSNSVKFTKTGGRVIIDTKETENGMIEVSIKDSGIGMTEDTRNKLFMIGEKTGRSGTDGEESTGLGLLLCKEFVEKHGGKIWVESEENIGSTFYFTLQSIDKNG